MVLRVDIDNDGEVVRWTNSMIELIVHLIQSMSLALRLVGRDSASNQQGGTNYSENGSKVSSTLELDVSLNRFCGIGSGLGVERDEEERT